MAGRPVIDRPLVMFVCGTRPDAIKMAPLVQLTAQSARLAPYVVVTGQERAQLDQVHEVFGLHADADLELPASGPGIASVVAATMLSLTDVIREVKPAAVVVHGDTSAAFAAAQAAFYLEVPVVHLEAGLRTNDLSSPFPQEAHRQLVSRVAALHLAPTNRNRMNLLAENVEPDKIVVTGNTVIDALQQMAARVRGGDPATDGSEGIEVTDAPDGNGKRPDAKRTRRRRILVTTRRRHHPDGSAAAIARALARVAQARPDLDLVLPLDPDPVLRDTMLPVLSALPNVTIRGPMSYAEFIAELSRCDLVVTDSGGLQEEAPGLGKPVLVTRASTERPEAVEAGAARLVGVEEDAIVAAVEEVLEDSSLYERMATAVNPYGDGLASPRCLAAIEELLGVGQREPDFVAHEGSLTRRLRHLTGLPRTSIRARRASPA